MPAAPSRTRLTKEARREQLLDTAADLVLTRGFDALTMESVAQEAGASKTLGYAYFTNVEDLILSLWEREVTALYERVETASQGVEGFDDGIAAAVHAYFDIVEQRGMLLVLLQEGMGTRRMRPGRRPRNEFLRWLAGIIEQELDLEREAARAYAAVAARVADTQARIWVARRLPREEMEQGCVRFILAGLRAVASD